MHHESDNAKGKRRRWLRFALIVSLVAHLCLLVALCFWVFRVGGHDDGTSVAAGETPGQSEPTRRMPDSEPPAPEIPDELMQRHIERTIAEAEQLSDEQKLDKLDERLKELEETTSSEAIDEMAEEFHQWLGTKRRATEPAAEPVEGDFDTNTAQVHDMMRRRGPDDRWIYVAVLVDAEGRTMEVDVPAENGELLFDTIERIKKNPLGEKAYRRILMPLLDKLLQPRAG